MKTFLVVVAITVVAVQLTWAAPAPEEVKKSAEPAAAPNPAPQLPVADAGPLHGAVDHTPHAPVPAAPAQPAEVAEKTQ